METQKYARESTRRQFLHQLRQGGICLPAWQALSPRSFAPQKPRAQQNGSLVVISQTGAAPDKALPKALKEFEAANPGMTTKLVLYPEEKFVAHVHGGPNSR